MTNRVGRGVSGVVVAAMLLALMSVPLVASAATFEIDLPIKIIGRSANAQPGQQFDFGTFDVPAEFVGQECSVTATGNNNESVHIGNNILVASATTVVLEGVEDAPNKTTVANGIITLDEQVSFTLVLGDDPVFSAELDVIFDCEEPPPPTTMPETTTTEPETTTTEPETTTTEPETTTTEPETTTTEPETTTTEPEAETTTTATVEEETTTTVGETESTLPFTGVDSEGMALIALGALASGAGLVFLTRRSEESLDADA